MKNIKTKTAIELQNLAHNITYLRKQCSLSKKDMTQMLEISTGTLNMFEKGEVPPRISVDIVINTWKYFNVCPGKLLEIRLDEK